MCFGVGHLPGIWKVPVRNVLWKKLFLNFKSLERYSFSQILEI